MVRRATLHVERQASSCSLAAARHPSQRIIFVRFVARSTIYYYYLLDDTISATLQFDPESTFIVTNNSKGLIASSLMRTNFRGPLLN